MDHRVGKADDREKIEAEAAEWVIRLGADSVSDSDRSKFLAWRARSPRHAKEFDLAQSTWGDLAGLRDAPGVLAKDIVRVPARGRIENAGALTFGWRRSHLISAGILAICVVAAVCLSGFWYGNPLTMLAADYQTAPGEHRTVTLPDGSSVDLSSGSAIALHFSERERRVELLQGAGYFTAAPMGTNEKRPFVVQGENGTATALGTQFLVNRFPNAVEVSVAEHEVRVALDSAETQTGSVVLSPGQSVRYSPDTGIGLVQKKNVELASAWRRGRLVFDQVPLGDVVAELNRYRRGHIVIYSNTLASRKVSGVFQTNDLDNALHTISQELRLRTASVPPLVTVLY